MYAVHSRKSLDGEADEDTASFWLTLISKMLSLCERLNFDVKMLVMLV